MCSATRGQWMDAHLVSLVDSIDELWAWSTPCETDCGGVDSLRLDVPWWDRGHLKREDLMK